MYSINDNRKHAGAAARSPILTRELPTAERATAFLRQDEPDECLLTDAERETSVSEFMKARPADNLWVFGYGVARRPRRRRELRTAVGQGWTYRSDS